MGSSSHLFMALIETFSDAISFNHHFPVNHFTSISTYAIGVSGVSVEECFMHSSACGVIIHHSLPGVQVSYVAQLRMVWFSPSLRLHSNIEYTQPSSSYEQEILLIYHTSSFHALCYLIIFPSSQVTSDITRHAAILCYIIGITCYYAVAGRQPRPYSFLSPSLHIFMNHRLHSNIILLYFLHRHSFREGKRLLHYLFIIEGVK